MNYLAYPSGLGTLTVGINIPTMPVCILVSVEIKQLCIQGNRKHQIRLSGFDCCSIL